MVEQRRRVGSDKKTVKDDRESGREWDEKKNERLSHVKCRTLLLKGNPAVVLTEMK